MRIFHFVLTVFAGAFIFLAPSAHAQVFIGLMGGAAALSSGASTQANPPAAANYDPTVGPAWNAELGYHIDDWFSVRAGYIWNRNRIDSTSLVNGALSQFSAERTQQAVAGEVMLYVRKRHDWFRPYLSAGPAWVHLGSVNKPGLRVAVGADLFSRAGWGFRYSFSEMMSRNPFAEQLTPRGSGTLMNFQNLFGVVKTF